MSHADLIKLKKWRLIKLTGWTPEQVDALTLQQMYEFLQIEDGITKANQ